MTATVLDRAKAIAELSPSPVKLTAAAQAIRAAASEGTAAERWLRLVSKLELIGVPEQFAVLDLIEALAK